ncbi:MAG TPA: polysaccharide biosynthesis/export family protein [Blastocatellia bacterium]|nr:polysaccharide biosynthesis/export family protein [Blastocatellia bacterium]
MKRRDRNEQTSLARSATVLVIAALALAAGSPARGRAQAQTQTKPQSQYQPPPQPRSDPVVPTVIVSPDEDYRIGPSDVIEIMVEDAPELSREFRVSADGNITMPFLGRLAARNKTSEQLARMIADGLRGEYLNDPQVTVTVKQINSRTYFIQGAVRRPGLYQVEGRPTLLMLISIAGGLSDNYGSTAFIIHQIKAGAREGEPEQKAELQPSAADSRDISSESDAGERPGYELIKVNINGLLRGNFNENVVIEPGDIIHVPPTDVFFVAGEVNAPGSFPLKEGTTLRQAISLAQGTSFAAAASRGAIFREDPATGKRQEMKIDIAAVMSGKKEDIPIIPNDIVIVPNSRLKSVGGTLLRAFGVSATRIPLRYGY